MGGGKTSQDQKEAVLAEEKTTPEKENPKNELVSVAGKRSAKVESGGKEDFNSKNPYEVLGVPKDASGDEIKKRYKSLALEHHPDRAGDEEKFKKISEAYDVINSTEKRARYNRYEEKSEEIKDASNLEELYGVLSKEEELLGSDGNEYSSQDLIRLIKRMERAIKGEMRRVILNRGGEWVFTAEDVKNDMLFNWDKSRNRQEQLIYFPELLDKTTELFKQLIDNLNSGK